MFKKTFAAALLAMLLVGCGFHLQGILPLPEQLKSMYIQAPDTYGYLARNLEQYLKMSGVEIASDPTKAQTIFVIIRDANSQKLSGISSTQQTRTYTLTVGITFEINDNSGRTIFGPESLSEDRTITVQSDQILGSSNEANMFYQQMRRHLAYAIMNRLASQEVNQIINKAYQPQDKP